MVSKTGNAMLVAVVASAMTITASAQTRPPIASVASSTVTVRTDAARTRTMILSQQGLNNPALDLSDAQRAQISEIIDAYVAEQTARSARSPIAKDPNASRTPQQARLSPLANLTAKLGSVMNDEQRKIWEPDLAARRLAAERSSRSARAGSGGK